MRVNIPLDLKWNAQEYALQDGVYASAWARLLRNAIMEQVVLRVNYPMESAYENVQISFQ